MTNIIKYFDLNHRTSRATTQKGLTESKLLQSIGGGDVATPQISMGEQLFMYFGIVVGVMFSSAVSQFKAGQNISLKITVATILVSLVVAIAILPSAFEKLSIKPDSPLLVRFGLFVQHGIFWNVLFAAIGKAISP